MKHTKLILLAIVGCSLFAILFSFCSKNQQDREVKNLYTFAKMYGYVRYFHPSDEASYVNWDWFVVNGVSKVKNARNTDELQRILQELFYPIAPTIDIYKKGESPKGWQVPKDMTGLKIVAWQHYGVDLGSEGYKLYKSERLKRNLKDIEDRKIFRRIDAHDLQGKKVTLNLKMKSDFNDTSSYAILMITSYDTSDTQNNLNIVEDTIRKSGLNKYKLTAKVNQNATNLNILVVLHGKARLVFDNFQLEDNDGKKFRKINFRNSDFEEMDAFRKPALWGLYPKSSNDIYLTNIQPLSGNYSLVIENNKNYNPYQLFNDIPNIGEVINKDIGNGLICRIPIVLLSNENHTIGKKDGYKFIINEYSPRDLKYYSLDDENVRLADVIISWNVFQHFFPYFEYLSVNWNKSLTNALKKALSDSFTQDFIETLDLLLEPLKDGHIGVNYKDNSKKYFLPFSADWVEDKVVVKISTDTSAFKPGDIITHVDSIPVKKLLEEKAKRISGSRQWKLSTVFKWKLLGEGNSKNTVKIKVESLKSNKEIVTKRVSEYDFWKTPDSELNPISLLNSNIYYINGSKVDFDNFVDNLKNIKNSKGIIIDLREYPNNAILRILSYLTKKPINSPNMYIPEIIYPDRVNLKFNKTSWQITPQKPFLKCRKVFLVGNGTMSYGETLSSLVKFSKLGIVLGQYTAGANGNVNTIKLPGNIDIYFTGMKVVNEDNSRFFVKGVEPDIFVNKTIKAVKEGRDEYLEKALEILK